MTWFSEDLKEKNYLIKTRLLLTPVHLSQVCVFHIWTVLSVVHPAISQYPNNTSTQLSLPVTCKRVVEP